MDFVHRFYLRIYFTRTPRNLNRPATRQTFRAQGMEWLLLVTHLDKAMADLCCSRSAAIISGAFCRGEGLVCRKHNKATTARAWARLGLASGMAAILAIRVAVCSWRKTLARVASFRTAVRRIPAEEIVNYIRVGLTPEESSNSIFFYT